MTEYLFYNDGNNLLLEGDFGYIKYNKKTYFSTQVRFFNPSLHTFGHNRMPLELQIIHQDGENNQITVSIFFKFSTTDYSIFLSKLGFDNESLSDQKALQPISIKNEIHLEQFVSDNKDFFAYESKMILPPCKGKSLNLIITDVMNVSERQLLNFPKIINNKNREIQKRNKRKIYKSFNDKDAKKKMKMIKEQIAINKDNERKNNILNHLNENLNKDKNDNKKGNLFFFI